MNFIPNRLTATYGEPVENLRWCDGIRRRRRDYTPKCIKSGSLSTLSSQEGGLRMRRRRRPAGYLIKRDCLHGRNQAHWGVYTSRGGDGITGRHPVRVSPERGEVCPDVPIIKKGGACVARGVPTDQLSGTRAHPQETKEFKGLGGATYSLVASDTRPLAERVCTCHLTNITWPSRISRPVMPSG
jgi:hypothetical protein